MRFPKAYSGVKKIFIAMILTLVAAVLGVTASVLLALPGASEANSGLALAAGGIGIGLAVVTLVALVLEFVGLLQGGQDSHMLKLGLWFVIISLVLVAVTIILQFVPNTGTAVSIMNAAEDVLGTLVNFCIGEFYNEGIQAVYDMVDNWNRDYLKDCKCSDRNLMDRMLSTFPRKLPVVKRVGRRNVKSVIEECDAYRRKVRR